VKKLEKELLKEPKPKKKKAEKISKKEIKKPKQKFKLPLIHPAIIIGLIIIIIGAVLYLLIPQVEQFIKENWLMILIAVAAIIIIGAVLFSLRKKEKILKYAITILIIILAAAFIYFIVPWNSIDFSFFQTPGQAAQDFLALYGNFIIIGIVLLLIIIFFLRLSKDEK